MKVTVCELNAHPQHLEGEWQRLIDHVKTNGTDLVLLPEMPFSPWFGISASFDQVVWRSAVDAHERWLERLEELFPAIVLGSRPVDRNGIRLNEGFRWDREAGYTKVHDKYYLPDEPGFWEASWYSRGDGGFDPVLCASAKIGFAICTELWSFDQAARYGVTGVHIIATPRATPQSSLERWVVAGRAAAITSGTFSLSSNHVSTDKDPVHLGGQGWVIDPEGEVLAQTSPGEPFVTVELDLSLAEKAKKTYPRYVFSE